MQAYLSNYAMVLPSCIKDGGLFPVSDIAYGKDDTRYASVQVHATIGPRECLVRLFARGNMSIADQS